MTTDNDTPQERGDNPARNWPGSDAAEDDQSGLYHGKDVGRREVTETANAGSGGVRPLTEESAGQADDNA